MLLIPARVEGILVNREKKISQKKTRVLKKEKIVYKNCIYTKKRGDHYAIWQVLVRYMPPTDERKESGKP